jgi:hypothetical protein
MVQHLVGKKVCRKCVFPAPLCAQGALTARRLPRRLPREAAGGQREGEEDQGNLLLPLFVSTSAR